MYRHVQWVTKGQKSVASLLTSFTFVESKSGNSVQRTLARQKDVVHAARARCACMQIFQGGEKAITALGNIVYTILLLDPAHQ